MSKKPIYAFEIEEAKKYNFEDNETSRKNLNSRFEKDELLEIAAAKGFTTTFKNPISSIPKSEIIETIVKGIPLRQPKQRGKKLGKKSGPHKKTLAKQSMKEITDKLEDLKVETEEEELEDKEEITVSDSTKDFYSSYFDDEPSQPPVDKSFYEDFGAGISTERAKMRSMFKELAKEASKHYKEGTYQFNDFVDMLWKQKGYDKVEFKYYRVYTGTDGYYDKPVKS